MHEARAFRSSSDRCVVLMKRMQWVERALQEYRLRNPGTSILPAVELCTTRPVRTVIELPSTDPVDFMAISTLLDALNLSDVCATWSEAFTLSLQFRIPQDIRAIHAGVDALCLATVWFSHTYCTTRPMRRSELAVHNCTSSCTHGEWDFINNPSIRSGAPEVLFTTSMMYFFRRLGWISRVTEVDLDTYAYAKVRHVVTMCDKNPDRVTFSEMDEFDFRFLCLRCWKVGAPCAMGWRGVVSSSNYYML